MKYIWLSFCLILIILLILMAIILGIVLGSRSRSVAQMGYMGNFNEHAFELFFLMLLSHELIIK